MGLSRTIYEIIENFPTSVYLMSPLRGFHWNFVMAVWLNKLEWCPTTVKKYDNMSIRLDTVLALDRRRDGIGKPISHSICIHSMLMQDKNVKTAA